PARHDRLPEEPGRHRPDERRAIGRPAGPARGARHRGRRAGRRALVEASFGCYYTGGTMPGGFAPRFAIEAGFLILLGVGSGYANLRTVVIVAVLLGGWLLVSLIEVA